MINIISLHRYLPIACLLMLSSNSYTLEDNWDNQLYLANKLTWGSNRWRYSSEVQLRIEDNMQSFQKVYAEGVARFLYSERIEFIPDFRISKVPGETVFRPGLSILYKPYINNFQFVNQIKWQIDIHSSDGQSENALRYVLVINKQLSNKIIGSFLAGALYRWSDDFNGIELIRVGPGITYIINRKYSLFINYYLSAENNHQNWEWSGIPFFQFIINLNKPFEIFEKD